MGSPKMPLLTLSEILTHQSPNLFCNLMRANLTLTTFLPFSTPTSPEETLRTSSPTSQHQSPSLLPKNPMPITFPPSSTPTSPEETSRTSSPTSQHQSPSLLPKNLMPITFPPSSTPTSPE